MPSASPELRALMAKRFGSLGDEGPMRFLLSRGYSLGRDWQWSKSGVSSVGDMQRDEYETLLFLIHEWDYGGLRKPEPSDG